MFNPTRLDLARRRRGLTKWTLTDKLDVTLMQLACWIKGKEVPDDTMIDRMSEVLYFPPSFFHGPTLEEPQVMPWW